MPIFRTDTFENGRSSRHSYVTRHRRNETRQYSNQNRPCSRGGPQKSNAFELSDGFAELGISEPVGINFDAYDEIPVETSGSDVPPPVNTFAELALAESLNQNIRRCNYSKPTPVQRYAVPISLAGRDLMACAQTGSGKTAAFCFPIISGIIKTDQLVKRELRSSSQIASPLALILSPTRELACQIHDEAKKFSYQTGVKVVVIYGGSPIYKQFCDLARGVHILVATPGRLVDMIERGRVSLKMIKYLALDEADRMLDMGFELQIRRIVEQTGMPLPGTRQTMLFSATFPTEIQQLASDFLSNYIFLAVGRVGSSTDLISQRVEFVQEMEKQCHLMELLCNQRANGKQALTIVFVETKRGADSLERWLRRSGFPATAIHGDKTQPERERALRLFKNGTMPIMVATDIAARGLDVPNVSHVVNFDLPKDIDDYVHRIGRTGRAGKSGLATAFFNEKNEPLAKSLTELMKEANQDIPVWLSQYAETSYCVAGRKNCRYGSSSFGGQDFRRDAPSRVKEKFHYSNAHDGSGDSCSDGQKVSSHYATSNSNSRFGRHNYQADAPFRVDEKYHYSNAHDGGNGSFGDNPNVSSDYVTSNANELGCGHVGASGWD